MKRPVTMLVCAVLLLCMAGCEVPSGKQNSSDTATTTTVTTAADDATAETTDTTVESEGTQDSEVTDAEWVDITTTAEEQPSTTVGTTTTTTKKTEISSTTRRVENVTDAPEDSVTQVTTQTNTARPNPQGSENSNADSATKAPDRTTTRSTAVNTTESNPKDTTQVTTKTKATTSKTTAQSTTQATTVTTSTTKKVTTTTTKTTTIVTSQVSVPAVADEVLRLVNEERAAEGLQPLTYRGDLQTLADIRAAEIVEQFDHTRPDGTSCFTVFDEAGVVYRTVGENIACGQQTPERVMTAWMNSSGHRSNIMNADFEGLIVGYVDVNGYPYWVQLFITTFD